jgi:predicted ATP-binding protein involved in virulence
MDCFPPELVVFEKGTNTRYKVSQLSDGYRGMLALVMDLARRMAIVHASAPNQDESILSMPAIVLIDEIEMHLHSSWQQSVLTTLLDIFPNTQFIVTTHSPQVLTSIEPQNIRLLRDGKACAVDTQTKGADGGRLMDSILGVNPRPQNLDVVRELNEYADLVYDEKWDTERAKTLYNKLVDHFGCDEPMLKELELHIENSKWELGL